ncbi:DUF72 domain-containing protein [Flavobacterium sp. U410]
MKFGKVEYPELIDFSLPEDNLNTNRILNKHKIDDNIEVFVGCAKWNKNDLKGFYPKGTKDELTYYATQFNAIELNATFYKMPDWKQVNIWKNKTSKDFKFFPKLPNTITHYKRLSDVQEYIIDFCDAVSNFEDKLGMTFMQLHENFSYKEYDKLKRVLENFPENIPLAVEVRSQDWFLNSKINQEYSLLLEELGLANIIVDTAGRRDMLHMRLTTPVAFVRFVGANHKADYERLDDWVKRIKKWKAEGLQSLYFFVHQNIEVESPLLAKYFIENLNKELGIRIKIPNKSNQETLRLFD